MNVRTGILAAGLGLVGLVLSATAALAVEAVATTAVNVRSGPGTSFMVVDTLHAGEAVDVVECNATNTWCRVEHSGPDGWVSRSYLGAPPDAGSSGSPIEFGFSMPLPGGGSITFGTPGYTPPAPPSPTPGTARVCVFDLPNYQGASVCVNAGHSDNAIGPVWNNKVTSLRVHNGASIRLCQNANFGGFCNVFSSNRPLLGAALNNKASSYDVMPPHPKRVCVYDLPNYQGASVCVNPGASDNAINPPWNNRVTSLRVFGGAHIRLCQNTNFVGFCNVFTSDVPTLGVPLNNKASSYQTW